MIQSDALRRDPLDGYLIGRRRTVSHDLLSPLHPVPCFLVEGVLMPGSYLYLCPPCLSSAAGPPSTLC